MSAQNQPTVFHDSLERRALSSRFRGMGNPFAFLDEIGITPIKEFLYHGANIIDIAERLNLPITIIQRWIEENNYGPDIEEASVISAEGYIYQGEKLLKSAQTKFDLDKAKALLEHGRFMAGKKNKKVYGTVQDVAAGPAAVTYTFNVGQQVVKIDAHKAETAELLEAEYSEVPRLTLSPDPNGYIEANKAVLEAGAAVTAEGLVVHDEMLEALGPKPAYLEDTADLIDILLEEPVPTPPVQEPKHLQEPKHFPINKDKTRPGHYVAPPVEHIDKEPLREVDKWDTF